MRNRRVLQFATVVVAVAVAGHLLMHLQPHEHPVGAAHHGVEHAAAASASVGAAGASTPHEADPGHLMAALCMAVLAAFAAFAVLTGRSAPRSFGSPAAVGRHFPLRLRAPAPSRVDAGVLLRVQQAACTNLPDAGHSGHGDMPGMGEEERERLAALDGVDLDLDLACIDMVAGAHQGAITPPSRKPTSHP